MQYSSGTAASESSSRLFIGAALGLFITQIGYSPISSTLRFTFDSFYLAGGFNALTVLIGLFAGSMIMIDYATKNGSSKNNFNQKIEKFYFPGKEILENKFNILRSFLIGLFIDFLPGMGPALSNVVSYSTAKSSILKSLAPAAKRVCLPPRLQTTLPSAVQSSRWSLWVFPATARPSCCSAL